MASLFQNYFENKRCGMVFPSRSASSEVVYGCSLGLGGAKFFFTAANAESAEENLKPRVLSVLCGENLGQTHQTPASLYDLPFSGILCSVWAIPSRISLISTESER